MQRDASAKSIKRGVEASLKALAKDYIDLYQVHWPDPNSPFEETATALHEAVEAGKIRHVGVSSCLCGWSLAAEHFGPARPRRSRVILLADSASKNYKERSTRWLRF